MTATVSAYGRLGKDPEARTSKSGKPWATTSLAVQAGDDDAALWFGLVAFGKVSETLCKHAKGEPISVSGRLQMNKWTDREGKEHEQLQIVVDSVISARTVRPGGKRKAKEQTEPQSGDGAGGRDSDLDDAIPF